MIFNILFSVSIITSAISMKNFKSTNIQNSENENVRRDEVVLKQSSINKPKQSRINQQNDFVESIATNELKYRDSVAKKFDQYYSNPIILERKTVIRTLDSFKGIIPDSLILTKNPSEVIIKLNDNDSALASSKLRCLGSVYLQRVKIYCDLLVTPYKEIKVKVLVREDIDGASTLLPDKFYTGEEARFIKQSFASMFSGAMDASKDRITTSNGQEELVNSQNKIYGALFNVSDNASRELSKEASDVQVAAVINSGRTVRIEFLEGVINE